MPSDEQISEYINQGCGMDVDKFMADYTKCKGIFHYSNEWSRLEKDTLTSTLRLSDEMLVVLWNTFIEESALYGQDSYIFDLENMEDYKLLVQFLTIFQMQDAVKASLNENVQFIQKFYGEDGIRVKKDIKAIIKAYWREMLERILVFPQAYMELKREGKKVNYFFDFIYPSLIGEIGFTIDENKGELVRIKK